jgi:hypothetical protein
MTRILLGQLGSNGDCLYATTIARQIKHDFPGCHLTWAVSSLARSVLTNNPDIDQIWELPLATWEDMNPTWAMFEREAMRLHNMGVYDHVFLTQIAPTRFGNYDGTIRPSIFRNYGRPITVPVESVINLTEAEVDRVDRWHAASPAAGARYTILFECSSKSGQSFMTPAMAVQAAEKVTRKDPSVAVLISTHEQIETDNPRIASAGALTMRENARLTHHVDLFVGCGSGLTVVATSPAAKPGLPTIQVLSRHTENYASFRHDFEYFGKPTEQFMEFTTQDAEPLADAILDAVRDGFAVAKQRHDDPLPLTFDWYLMMIDIYLIQRAGYADAANALRVTAERYGAHPKLREFAAKNIVPFLRHDPRSAYPDRAAEIEGFRAVLGL